MVNASLSEDFSTFLDNIQWSEKEINIRAYANAANIRSVLGSVEGRHSKSKGTLLLFTNKDKYTYVYTKPAETFECQLNPHVSKRETTEQNFLYVLCRHARTATAALNLISKQLTKLDTNPSAISSSISDSILFASTVEPPSLDINNTLETKNSSQIPPSSVSTCLNIDLSNLQTTTNLNAGKYRDRKRPHTDEKGDDGNKHERQNIAEGKA